MAVCKECGLIFTPEGPLENGLCQHCKATEAEAFDVLKEYIHSHPTASVIEVIRDTDIPYKTVQRMLNSGKIARRDTF